MRVSVARSLEAGPIVATILVARGIKFPWVMDGGCWCDLLWALHQDFDRRQGLAFQKLQEGAAAGRDIADLVGNLVFGNRGQRIAAAGDRKRVRLGNRQRQGPGSCTELVELEHADRAVP